MLKNERRVGIMGGTFDPIHYGHLMAAEAARSELALDCVLFLPSGTPPHKHYPGMADAEARYAMTLIATADNPYFRVSRMETCRVGTSYTRDTLNELTALYPQAEWFLIVGLDSALDMPNWHKPLEICRLCTIVVIPRVGFDLRKLSALPSQISEKLYTLNVVPPDISSTRIRNGAASGKSIRYSVPAGVEAYICKNDIYTVSDGEAH